MANLIGESNEGNGVEGRSNAVSGITPGVGVSGFCEQNIGVEGVSNFGTGVHGRCVKGFGVIGECHLGIGVFGKGSKLAASFEGDVEVTGNINGHPTSKITCFDVSLIGGDCAEEFDVGEAESIEPGTVMVLGEEGGALHQSRQAYDKRVAGVISGAGGYKPGVVLDKRDTRANRVPLALLGKVYCKVDANYEPIEVGDLLTTSDRPGHAMKATEPLKAFGSTIGKALQPLKEGQGLVPILIALQ
jgi:hypothetical protein